MKYLLILMMAMTLQQDHTMVLFESGEDNLSKWFSVDDGVMGGVSEGEMELNESGNLHFTGQVRLENNGGFSSIRCGFSQKQVADYNQVLLKVKGDGKPYQFRIKSSDNERQSYVHDFETSGSWETIEMPLADFYPIFHGEKLNRPDYPGETMTEIGILIGNKRKEQFSLEVAAIWLEGNE